MWDKMESIKEAYANHSTECETCERCGTPLQKDEEDAELCGACDEAYYGDETDTEDECEDMNITFVWETNMADGIDRRYEWRGVGQALASGRFDYLQEQWTREDEDGGGTRCYADDDDHKSDWDRLELPKCRTVKELIEKVGGWFRIEQ